MKKKILAAFLAVLMLILCCACTTQGENLAKQLVYGSGNYTAINSALFEHGEINLLLFSGLTKHNDKNEVVGDLAKDWEYDETTLTYTFNLKDNIVWHDGEKFKAEDVKFTLEAIMNPDNASENASNFEEIKAIEIVDEKTIKIELSAPSAAMPDYLTIGILPSHLLEGKDMTTDEFNQNPIGTGPYKLKSWEMGQNIVLEKNNDFYGTVAKIDTVIFKIVEDYKVRALQLQSGELDMAQVTPQDMGEFENNEKFKVYDMKTSDYRGIMYNFGSEFFSKHKELPNILSYAIDRQAIVSAVLLDKGEVAYSPLQAGEYNNPDMEKFSYDPEKAQSLLEEAGWEKNSSGIYEKNGEELSFVINNGAGDQVRIDMSNIAAQQLRDIGVNATVEVQSQVDWAGQDTYLIGWGSPFDPDDHTYKVFGTDQGANYSGYSNAKVDEILLKARAATDSAERKALYNEFQKEIAKDMPYTFIAYVDAIYIAPKELKGITENTILGHHGVGIFWNITDWTM